MTSNIDFVMSNSARNFAFSAASCASRDARPFGVTPATGVSRKRPCSTALRHFCTCESYKPSRRRIAPRSPLIHRLRWGL